MRELIDKVKKKGELTIVKREVDPYLEMASIQSQLDGKVVLYEKVKGSDMKVISGICSSREYFALALGVDKKNLLHTMIKAMKNPKEPELVSMAPCQEIVERVSSVLDPNAKIIWGATIDKELGDAVKTLLVVTGITSSQEFIKTEGYKEIKKKEVEKVLGVEVVE